MKKLVYFVCLFVCLACQKDSVFETTLTEIIVVDENNLIVEGAALTLYTSQQDFTLDRNPIGNPKWVSNQEGSVFLVDIDKKISTRYWISIEAGEKNNWDTPKLLDMVVLPERLVVIVKSTPANDLAGRLEKRWKQLHQTINGQRFEECDKKNEFVFRRDFTMEVYASSVCANGSLIRKDVWQLGNVSNQLVLGTPTRPTLQKNITILELSPTKFTYYYTLKSSTGQDITVVEEMVAATI